VPRRYVGARDRKHGIANHCAADLQHALVVRGERCAREEPARERQVVVAQGRQVFGKDRGFRKLFGGGGDGFGDGAPVCKWSHDLILALDVPTVKRRACRRPTDWGTIRVGYQPGTSAVLAYCFTTQ
jgi:hypothetical protein